MPCFNRKCTGLRKTPIPRVGEELEDYRGYNRNQDGQTDNNNDMYRFDTQYDGDRRDRGGRGRADDRDPLEYKNNYRSQQYPRKEYRNQQGESQDPYDNADIEQIQYNSNRYGQDGDPDVYGRPRRPQQSNNRYNSNDYDVNGAADDDYGYKRRQNPSQRTNQYNRPSYGRGFDDDADPDSFKRQDNFQRPRYNQQNNDLDDPIESFGEPYNFPAESLKQEKPYDSNPSKTSAQFPQTSRGSADFQYLNSPVKEPLADADSQQIASNLIYPTNRNEKLQEYNDALLPKVPSHCFKSLTIAECSDARVVGNFWFYNHCTDECMLYTVDICDHNLNRFPSLEQCEEQCAVPARRNPKLLLQKQKTAAHCQEERYKR